MRLQITVAFTLVLLIASAFVSLTQVYNIQTKTPDVAQVTLTP
ncbi:MAG: hypothetical protein ACK5MJ_02540 [Alphaproteobacteria bacterium]